LKKQSFFVFAMSVCWRGRKYNCLYRWCCCYGSGVISGNHWGSQSLPLPSPFSSSQPSLPLRSRTPKIQLEKRWRSAVSSLGGVWGRTPAKIEFGACQP